jgi:hypothetical protein
VAAAGSAHDLLDDLFLGHRIEVHAAHSDAAVPYESLHF